MNDAETARSDRKWAIAGGVLLALVVLVWSRNFRKPLADTLPPQAFYTVDGGKTWFVDASEKLAPFDHDGRTAYRCHVFTCDGGKTKFAGFLERYTAEGKEFIKQEQRRTGRFDPANAFMHVEVRRPGPGDGRWVKLNTPAGRAITDVKCPKGAGGEPQLVSP